MDFYELSEFSQIEAINAAITLPDDYIWRIKCRYYSIKYNTPLHVVINELDPLFVLQTLYEEQYTPKVAEEELEELIDTLQKIKDPTYNRISAQETEDLVDMVLNKELARLAKKKRPTQETIEAAIKEADSKPKPKSGSMNFGDLEKLEAESESNKAGFDSQ